MPLTTKEIVTHLKKQFAIMEDVTFKAMMGGYLCYYKDRIFGGVYEPGFMVKITNTSKKYLPLAKILPPYKGAKDMILVNDEVNRGLLCHMVEEMSVELPVPKQNQK